MDDATTISNEHKKADKQSNRVKRSKGAVIALRVFAGICIAFDLFALLCSIVMPIMLPAVICIFVLCVFLWIKAPYKTPVDKSNKVDKSKLRVISPCRMKHRGGLPIADGSECTFDATGNRFLIRSGGGSWELAKSKVVNVENMTETEIQTHLKNRPGMALLGGVTFGVVGAVVGGAMTKEKKSRVVTQYLCITYRKDDGELDTLLFQYEDYQSWYDKWRPKLVVKDFQKNRSSYGEGSHHTL